MILSQTANNQEEDDEWPTKNEKLPKSQYQPMKNEPPSNSFSYGDANPKNNSPYREANSFSGPANKNSKSIQQEPQGNNTLPSKPQSVSKLPPIRVTSLKEAEDAVDKMYWGMCVLVRDLTEQRLGHHFMSSCKFSGASRDSSEGSSDSVSAKEVEECATSSPLYGMFVSEFNRINVGALSDKEKVSVSAKCQRALLYLKTRQLYNLVLSGLDQ